MSVLDLLPHCVSGVYFLYHSDFDQWQFGKLSALRETALALQGGYQYYYMGYYIHSCTKMRYKGDYSPQHVLDPESYEWNPLNGELRTLLDKKSYVSLARERRRKENASTQSGGGLKYAEGSQPEDEDKLDEYPFPTAAEAGEAVSNGTSLFDLKVPGLMTVEEIEEQLDLGTMPIKVGGRMAEAQDLVSWDGSTFRDSRTAKGIISRPIKNLPESVNVSPDATTAEIYEEIAKASKFSIHRLRVTKGSDGSAIPNGGDMTVHDTGVRNKSAVDVKDLGPQISWRTVFVVEYLGPLLIHPLMYLARPVIYGTSAPASSLQKLTLLMCVIHFAKREFETFFVHRFSSATMPIQNIYKNSGYYWIMSGLNLAYWTYGPNSPAARPSNPLLTSLGVALFAIGEICNYSTHMTLKNLRRAGTTDRGIPQGLGFNLVTCPNYMFEAIAWIGVALVNWSLSTVLFITFAVGQMGVWAWKKERRYRKEFGDKYKRKRYAILPGLW
ncbi:3-oxo-5-alpha-steroid 4-dehydrogenase-domain-containing protein [Ampelomyces quisqualis]|uniref:very-long-chain enoyl-CoA reductase n=1 Tax=Ampelomyces quisqualis TaxID=50730 RepID=A0A6A5QQE6_AMPQU|nr:3-oxo-5-alpha-steroid 4-dehydrogenase-domain-containing protein [Ampelomyces quisqualis]